MLAYHTCMCNKIFTILVTFVQHELAELIIDLFIFSQLSPQLVLIIFKNIPYARDAAHFNNSCIAIT